MISSSKAPATVTSLLLFKGTMTSGLTAVGVGIVSVLYWPFPVYVSWRLGSVMFLFILSIKLKKLFCCFVLFVFYIHLTGKRVFMNLF